jgi:hypothetical protein
MDYIALWPAFGITPGIREKLMRTSPTTIALTLKGKSLTTSADILKHRIPHPHLLHLTGTETARFYPD